MIYFQLLILVGIVGMVVGHARLIEPPSRSSMWRYGFNTLVNYNDNELFCGGLAVQHYTNKGRCGVCGDPYNVPQPRPNEAGGLYGKGIIVKTYQKGQVINIVVDVTANHLGYFEFKICPNNNPKKIVEQECLDKYPLYLSNNSSHKFYLKAATLGKVSVSVKLPEEVTCTQCVLQWQYKGGNNWGMCSDGRGALGCGPQETFRACADIAIVEDDVENNSPAPVEKSSSNFIKSTSFPFSLVSTASSKKPSSDSIIHSTVNKTSHITPTMKYSSTEIPTVNSKTTTGVLKSTLLEKLSTKPSLSTRDTLSSEAISKSIKSTKVFPSSSSTSILQTTVDVQTKDDISNTQNCQATSNMRNVIPGLDYWCRVNCVMGHCPPDLCTC